jgi:hypothetical protein
MTMANLTVIFTIDVKQQHEFLNMGKRKARVPLGCSRFSFIMLYGRLGVYSKKLLKHKSEEERKSGD